MSASRAQRPSVRRLEWCGLGLHESYAIHADFEISLVGARYEVRRQSDGSLLGRFRTQDEAKAFCEAKWTQLVCAGGSK